MSSRASLNKVLLIGNLTRDPELRYTPSGAAVCSFGIATNRFYVASDGSKKEETEFIKLVSWNKLAELCSQLLTKGRKVYVEGRMQTRSWETPDGQNRQTTEVVIDDMRILDSRRDAGISDGAPLQVDTSANVVGGVDIPADEKTEEKKEPKDTKGAKVTKGAEVTEDKPVEKATKAEDEVDLDDLPF